jgi:lysophospholipase L1-like esterase
MGLIFAEGQKILFIGDSITDCNRLQLELGYGYVRIAASLLGARYPGLGLQFVNMGIGGDTVRHLAARWETDVIDQNAAWVSISVGVNDAFRHVARRPDGVGPDEFEATYRKLLARTKEATAGKLILMETTAFENDCDAETNKVVKLYNGIIDKLAKDFNAVLIPMHSAWLKTHSQNPGMRWTSDGIHPTPAGHGLMARTWLDAVGFEW